MCYYETTDYACGDWKWGNMKLRCPRQHRMGETCGAKLIHAESVTKDPNVCRICKDLDTKQRRLRKEQENILRWSKEGTKFRASIEKAQGEARDLEDKIRMLYQQRPKVMMEMNGQSHGLGAGPAPAYASHSSSGQVSLPSIGHLDGSATRHASAAQGGYVAYNEGHAGSQGSRHAPVNAHSGRHAPAYSSSSSNSNSSRHAPSHHSGYAGTR